MTKTMPPSAIARLVAVALLLVALGQHPYGYYQILRWAVCGTSVFTAIVAYSGGKTGWVWAFGIMAVLFNPLAPIHMNRETWAMVDVVSGILCIVSLFFVREK